MIQATGLRTLPRQFCSSRNQQSGISSSLLQIFSKRHQSSSSNLGKKSKAFIFDIDGVLLHHRNVLPNARDSLERLHENRVPFVFLTNNGGKREVDRAQEIQRHLNLSFDIDPSHLIMSHTPMIDEAIKFQDEHVLVCGYGDIAGVASTLGLKKAITVEDLLAHGQDIYPTWNNFERNVLKKEPVALRDELHYSNINFKAVFVLHDSFFVMRDLQVILDVLRSNGTIGVDSISGKQDVPLYMSHADFLYASTHLWPRFGQGAFKLCLQCNYKELTGHELTVRQYGKPEKVTYDFAWKKLNNIAVGMGYSGVDHAYCIGDNPAADIKGANNAGDNFSSVLVRTGVFKGEGNDSKFPARYVVDNVGDFVLKEYFGNLHSL